MTKEEKELLLKDLSGRLPYGVKVTDGEEIYKLTSPFLYRYIEMNCRPYLRLMSSMTKEEENELQKIKDSYWFDEDGFVLFDWLNSCHFDYRGLIERGLAVEVTEENNPYKDL